MEPRYILVLEEFAVSRYVLVLEEFAVLMYILVLEAVAVLKCILVGWTLEVLVVLGVLAGILRRQLGSDGLELMIGKEQGIWKEAAEEGLGSLAQWMGRKESTSSSSRSSSVGEEGHCRAS